MRELASAPAKVSWGVLLLLLVPVSSFAGAWSWFSGELRRLERDEAEVVKR
jgi:hypothetical protein